MPKLGSYSVVCVCACVCACVTEYDHSGVLDTVEKICSWTYILMYRLSADQMGGTTSTVDVTTNSTVMLSFLHCWVIPQYIVLAPTTSVYRTGVLF